MHRLFVSLIPLLTLAVLFAVGTSILMPAQEVQVLASYPAAPVPEIPLAHAITKTPIQAPRTLSHGRRSRLNSISVATLVAGEAVDSWGTYKNMTHTKWVCGNSPAFTGGYDTNVPDEISGLGDVQAECGLGPAGQSANWAFDTTRAGYFTEGGWVTEFHLAGDRNYAGVEAWNIANDLGWYLVARRLGRWQYSKRNWGPALNFGRGIVHLKLGIGNFLSVRNQRNPNTLDLHVPKDSNYTAPRWWGKH